MHRQLRNTHGYLFHLNIEAKIANFEIRATRNDSPTAPTVIFVKCYFDFCRNCVDLIINYERVTEINFYNTQ